MTRRSARRSRPVALAVGLVAAVALAASACSTSSPSPAGSAAGPSGSTPGTSAPGGPGGTVPGTAVPGANPKHATGASAGCRAGTARPPAGKSEHTITSGGVPRVYELDLPPDYDGSTPYPVVLGLHALTVSYKFIASQTGFDDESAHHRFIGVAPSGRVDGVTPFWNAAPVADNYDVAFIGDLLDDLESTLCVDTSRVFSTGMSNGAQMSSLLACQLADRVTAIAPVSGVEYLEPCPGAPVPVLAFHGSADPILPYTGGGLNATTIANQQFYKGNLPAGLPAPLGVDESMRRWAAHNGCDPQVHEEQVAPHVRHRTWTGCKAATELYVVDGGGHAWPGKPMPQFEKQFGPGTTEVDASKLLFSFFLGPPAS